MSSFKQRAIRARLAGTAGLIGATDTLLCRNLRPRPIEGNYTEQSYADGQEGAKREELFDPRAGVAFEVDAGMFGPVGTALRIGPLLQGCGLSETIVADTSVTYSPTPLATPYAATEIMFQWGNSLQSLGDARGSLSFTANAGQRGFFNFDFMAPYNAPEAGTWPAADFSGWIDSPSLVPANINAFTVDGIVLCVSQFSFTDGRQPVVNKYMNCPGIDNVRRRFTGRMQIKVPDIATMDLVDRCRLGIRQPLVFDIDSETAAQGRLRITGPSVQMKFAGEQDIDGELGANIDLVFTPDQGDDEIAIIHLAQA